MFAEGAGRVTWNEIVMLAEQLDASAPADGLPAEGLTLLIDKLLEFQRQLVSPAAQGAVARRGLPRPTSG